MHSKPRNGASRSTRSTKVCGALPWKQGFVSDRMIRFFAWALAAVFLAETLAAFTWSRSEELWWMYGPVSLVIAALALVVAGSGSAWPRFHRPTGGCPRTEGEHSRSDTLRGNADMEFEASAPLCAISGSLEIDADCSCEPFSRSL